MTQDQEIIIMINIILEERVLIKEEHKELIISTINVLIILDKTIKTLQ